MTRPIVSITTDGTPLGTVVWSGGEKMLGVQRLRTMKEGRLVELTIDARLQSLSGAEHPFRIGIGRRSGYWVKPTRRLHLERDADVSGVSGLGVVAYGIEFPDGSIVLRWDTKVRSTVHYDSYADVETIVSHGGRTRIVYDD